jgi:rhomboid family GlyGly-CTERM serine protease
MSARIPWLTLALATAAVAIHGIPGAPEALQFERAAMADGAAWRWLTGHLTHFDANHLAWDVCVLMGLGWTCEREARTRCALALALSAPAISGAVWLFQPQFLVYRGLSGIDSAFFGLLAGLLLRRPQREAKIAAVAALLGIAAKSIFEVATSSTLFAEGAGYAPVPLAHLVGLGAGLLAAFAPQRLFAVAAQSVQQTTPLQSKAGELLV